MDRMGGQDLLCQMDHVDIFRSGSKDHCQELRIAEGSDPVLYCLFIWFICLCHIRDSYV